MILCIEGEGSVIRVFGGLLYRIPFADIISQRVMDLLKVCQWRFCSGLRGTTHI